MGARQQQAPARSAGLWLLVLLATAVRAQNLLSDGGFLSQPPPTGEYVDSSGAFERVTAGQGMRDFPGASSTAALRLAPDSSFIVRSSFGQRSTGWYRVRGFIYASSAYNGAQAPLTVDIVDSSGAPSPHTTSFSVALRPARDQWLHYDEWVPCYEGGHKAQLSFVPAHRAGDLQLAQLEVLFERFNARENYDISPLAMWLDPDMFPGGAPTTVACTATGPGECPPNWQSDGEIYYAFDGNEDSVYYMSSQSVPLIALELDLGETVEICALTVVYNGGLDASWRVKGRTEQGSWATLAEAGPARSEKMLVTNTAVSNAPLQCTDVRRIRIEMESSELLAKLYELIVLKRDGRCDCRHGGICQGDNECVCPLSASWPLRAPGETHFNHAFGWAGPTCDTAACDVALARGCDNDEPFNNGHCAGPNTCGCPAGWHGTSGAAEQCTHTICGDGVITTLATCTGVPCSLRDGACSCPERDNPVEQCDDGNNVANDGCSPTCQFEPLPAGIVRREIRRPGGILRVRDVVDSDNTPVSVETVALTIKVSPAEICCVEVVGQGREAEVLYTWMTVEFVLMCVGEMGEDGVAKSYCENDGVCELLAGEKICDCATIVREGDPYTVGQNTHTESGRGKEKTVEAGSALIGKYRSYEGATCEISTCEQECDHGGWCVKDTPDGVGYCYGCMDGWTGEFCGTADHPLRTVALIAAAAVAAVLALGLLLVVLRRNWLPILARGPVSLVCSNVGGVVWLYSAVGLISGEMAGYDAGRPGFFKLWLPLVFGSGLWLSASICYLRSMVNIHVFHKVPLIFPIMLAIGLVPWVLACYVEKFWIAGLSALACIIYVLVLSCQLRPLAAELPDCAAHALGCLAGLSIIVVQLFAVQGISVSESLSAGRQIDDPSDVKASSTVAIAIAIEATLLLHWLFTSAQLCLYSITRPTDPEILKHYHDEYAPIEGDFKLKAESIRGFDDDVKRRRAKAEEAKAGDSDFQKRLAKTRVGAIAAASFKKVKTTSGKIANPKALQVAKAKVSQTKTGQKIGAVSYNRKQYGARRVVKQPKRSEKAQRQRRASLEDFNARMQAKQASAPGGGKRVGFGADTDVGSPGASNKVHPARLQPLPASANRYAAPLP